MHFTIQRNLALVALAGSALLLKAEPEPKKAPTNTVVMVPSGRAPNAGADRIIERADLFFQSGTRQWAEKNTKLAQTQFDQAISTLLSAPSDTPNRAAIESRYRRMVEDIYRLEADRDDSVKDSQPAFEESPLDEIIDTTFPTDPKLKAQVMEQVRATASQLPLELTDPVVGFINYFQTTRGKNTLRFGLQRMGRYENMIRSILDEEGVPQELIHLAQAESAFQPRAMSYMRAGGMWQFIPSRGEEYGLHASQQHDERFDPERATRAAARHLRDLYETFGDWYLAVAAYNCGPYNVIRAVEHTGYADFWELYRRNMLPRETSNYVPIIIAMTIMAKNPAAYGLDDLKADAPVNYDSVELTAPTHLALVADLTATSLNEIRELNPAIHKMVAPAGYKLHVPKDSPSTMMAALESIPAERRASWRLHRVGSQETLETIARQYNTTQARISEANREADMDDMEEGEYVIIPVAYPGVVDPPRATPRRAARRSTKKAKVTVSATTSKAKQPAAAKSVPSKTAAKKSAAPKSKTVASARTGSRRES